MSTHRTRGLALATLAAVAVTLSLAPEASADRRSSLAGNLLIEDTDDIFIFPHTALEHTRLITFDLAVAGSGGPSSNAVANADGATSNFGSAGLLMGSEQLAFGLFTHRSDFFGAIVPNYYLMGDLDQHFGVANANTIANPGPLYPIGGPVGGVAFLPPLQWVDLVAAFQLGGGTDLGFRLSIGHNDQTVENDSTTDTSTSTTANSVLIGFGAGIPGEVPIDIGAELGFGLQNYENDTGTALQTIDATGISFAATGRAYVPMARGVDLGVVGLLYYRSLNGERVFDDQEASDFDFELFSAGLDVGAGPRYVLEDKFVISGYATIGLRSEDDEPNTNVDFDEENRTLIGVPMLKLSGEYVLFDWLKVRTGAHYVYSFVFTEVEPNDTTTTNSSFNASSFRWVAGAGVEWEGLELNGTFNQQFVLNGPNFIGGGTGTFALLNAQYAF